MMRLSRPTLARRPAAAGRPGLTLLEVIVALAVFLISLVALNHLINAGAALAVKAQQRSQAVSLCQSKLAEVAAGAVPLQSSSDNAFDEDPDFKWSLDAEQGATQGLWNVTVRVSRKSADRSQLEVSLSQMVLDPASVGNAQDTPAPNTSSGSGSGSSGSGPGSGS